MEKKVALITGSATGLGNRTAVELARNGYHVVLNYVHSKKEATETSFHIAEKYGVQSIAIQADISRLEEVQGLIKETYSTFGRIDLLVHNAGPFIKERKKLSAYTLDEWNKIVNGNLDSTFFLLKEVLPLMRKNKWGRIITMGFEKVETAPAWKYRSAFAATKSATVSLTKTIAIEEAENGITANMVCPGDIRGHFKEMNIENVRGIADMDNPVGRSGTGEDISRVISFLCHEKSDFITGAVIEVTGGKEVLHKHD